MTTPPVFAWARHPPRLQGPGNRRPHRGASHGAAPKRRGRGRGRANPDGTGFDVAGWGGSGLGRVMRTAPWRSGVIAGPGQREAVWAAEALGGLRLEPEAFDFTRRVPGGSDANRPGEGCASRNAVSKIDGSVLLLAGVAPGVVNRHAVHDLSRRSHGRLPTGEASSTFCTSLGIFWIRRRSVFAA